MDALLQYIDLYREHGEELCQHAPEVMNRPRPRALQLLMQARLPEKGDEKYPALSINDMFAPDYGVNINRVLFPVDKSETFKCAVPNISSLLALVVNDTFRPTTSLERNLPQGVTVKSLARAAEEDKELIDKYYATLGGMQDATADTTYLLNTLLAQDGVFVHVEKGVVLDKPLQIVNVFNASAPVMGVRRILIILEEGAQASLLLCDHSSDKDMRYLSCQVTEAFVGENASLEYYDLEESSALTSRNADIYVAQDRGSRVVMNGITLIGGLTRNNYHVIQNGPATNTHLGGIAIGRESQIVDNCTDVRHNCPSGESRQLFKYILDNDSKGSFYGTIYVDEKAKNTNAYQSNKNVLASKEAKMYTRPQLEIYCDEVKCSHGATVGQLDANALFYMRSRGIPEAEAKTMLMQAFMADVIDSVNIPALRSRLHQLVEMRLSGQMQLCAECSASDISDCQK